MRAWWPGLMALLASAASCKKSSTPSVTGSRSFTAVPLSAGPLKARLRDGDLLFQESTSPQSEMVSALTRSRWVKRTAFDQWIARRRGGR